VWEFVSKITSSVEVGAALAGDDGEFQELVDQ
jgi:hypothetical protein